MEDCITMKSHTNHKVSFGPLKKGSQAMEKSFETKLEKGGSSVAP